MDHESFVKIGSSVAEWAFYHNLRDVGIGMIQAFGERDVDLDNVVMRRMEAFMLRQNISEGDYYAVEPWQDILYKFRDFYI